MWGAFKILFENLYFEVEYTRILLVGLFDEFRIKKVKSEYD